MGQRSRAAEAMNVYLQPQQFTQGSTLWQLIRGRGGASSRALHQVALSAGMRVATTGELIRGELGCTVRSKRTVLSEIQYTENTGVCFHFTVRHAKDAVVPVHPRLKQVRSPPVCCQTELPARHRGL